MGSVGDSYDNVLAETINCLYKTQLIYQSGPWGATLKWVAWFHHFGMALHLGAATDEVGKKFLERRSGAA